MTSVAEFLTEHELASYADAFDEAGYDSMAQLRRITEPKLQKLVASVRMKPGHEDRLRDALGLPELAAAAAAVAFAADVDAAEAAAYPMPLPPSAPLPTAPPAQPPSADEQAKLRNAPQAAAHKSWRRSAVVRKGRAGCRAAVGGAVRRHRSQQRDGRAARGHGGRGRSAPSWWATRGAVQQ
jgi:hypothetical protein